MPAAVWIPVAIELASELISLIRLAAKEKEKAKQLGNLAKAWENAGNLKDILIRLYEEKQITTNAQKRRAKRARKLLEELQEALRALRRRITSDKDFFDEMEAAEEKARAALTELLML